VTDDLAPILADPDGPWLDATPPDQLLDLAPRLLATADADPEHALAAVTAAARAYQVVFEEYYVAAQTHGDARQDLVAGYMRALSRQVQLLAAAGRHDEVARVSEVIMAANEQITRKAKRRSPPDPPAGDPADPAGAAELELLEPDWVERTPLRDLPAIAERLNGFAGELEQGRQLERALRAVTEAVAARRRVVGQTPDEELRGGAWRPLASLLRHRIRLLRATGRAGEAAVVEAEIAALRERVDRAASAPPDQRSVSGLRQAGDLVAARAAQERLVADHEQVPGTDSPALAAEFGVLASICWELGDHDAGRAAAERAVALHDGMAAASEGAPPRPEAGAALTVLGSMLWYLGELRAARSALERAVSVSEQVSGPHSVELARRLAYLGTVCHDLADYAAARQAQERAVDILERWFRPEHRETLFVLYSLGRTLRALGDVAATRAVQSRAESGYEQVLARDERQYGVGHPRVARTRRRLRAVPRELRELPAPA
jgi:tetratricopeptide (TPR) repeat protein